MAGKLRSPGHGPVSARPAPAATVEATGHPSPHSPGLDLHQSATFCMKPDERDGDREDHVRLWRSDGVRANAELRSATACVFHAVCRPPSVRRRRPPYASAICCFQCSFR